MKKIIFAISIVSFSLLLFSCSKSKDEAPRNNKSLINKWNLIRATEKDLITGETDSYPLDEGSYLRFDDNGVCYSMVDGESGAGDWHYINNNKGVFIQYVANSEIQDSEFTIETLTEHSLVLHAENIKDVELTLYLEK